MTTVIIGKSTCSEIVSKGHNKVPTHLPVREQSGIPRCPLSCPRYYAELFYRAYLIRSGLTWYHKTLARYCPLDRTKVLWSSLWSRIKTSSRNPTAIRVHHELSEPSKMIAV